ncbi:hypothetical protein [Oceanobacillus kapialis]|uniref:Lipoprotein n=1 Tax=Oceanobacillus kapialis TaxID=481353 RepID=A0ABW5Q1M0_9BACI
MRLKIVFLLIIITLVFTGCTNEEAESTKEKAPSPSTEVGSQQVTPPSIGINKGESTTVVILDTHCWEENCSLTPNPPDELLLGETPLRVKPEDELELSVSTSEVPISDEIYSPDFNIVQVSASGEKETDVNFETKYLTAPTEEGKYYYNITTEWDGELTGKAIYAFAILVREE